MNPTSIRESWTSAAQGGIGAAIHRAAASTGVDFSYLLGQARIESGFNPNARAKTSSATGLFQFIDQTWLGTVKQHGAKHRLVREGGSLYPDCIATLKDGREVGTIHYDWGETLERFQLYFDEPDGDHTERWGENDLWITL